MTSLSVAPVVWGAGSGAPSRPTAPRPSPSAARRAPLPGPALESPFAGQRGRGSPDAAPNAAFARVLPTPTCGRRGRERCTPRQDLNGGPSRSAKFLG